MKKGATNPRLYKITFKYTMCVGFDVDIVAKCNCSKKKKI